MAQCTITKRIRLTDRVIKNKNIGEAKRLRYTQKKAYLETLGTGIRFLSGAKICNEGGYK